jgi:transposase
MNEVSQASQVSLGIDVAKAKCDVALLHAGKVTQRTFPMDTQGVTALRAWISKQEVQQVHACLEATGAYGAALALSLYEAGHLVSIVNPARIAA